MVRTWTFVCWIINLVVRGVCPAESTVMENRHSHPHKRNYSDSCHADMGDRYCHSSSCHICDHSWSRSIQKTYQRTNLNLQKRCSLDEGPTVKYIFWVIIIILCTLWFVWYYDVQLPYQDNYLKANICLSRNKYFPNLQKPQLKWLFLG